MIARASQMARQMRQMRKLKKQIEAITAEGSAGGGMVKVQVTGGRNVRRVEIDPSVVEKGDVELLESLVKAASNDAMRRLEKKLSQEPALRDLGGLMGS